MILRRPKPFLGFQKYLFVDPDTKFKFQATTLKGICSHIRTYREQNDLEPLEYLEDVVVHYNCMLPTNTGVCEPSAEPLKRNVIQYIKGGVSLLKNLLYHRMVSQEEADKRAAICKNCPHNVFPDRNKFIEWSDSIAEAATGGKKTADHDALGNCNICSCCLKAKVWSPPPFELSKKEDNKLPSFCWQKGK
jgi:hypothetical protein